MNNVKIFLLLGMACLACSGCKFQMGDKPEEINYEQAYTDARTALLQAANDEDPMTRSYAMEAIGQTLKGQEGGLLLEALSDPSVLVRFSAAMSLGDIRYAKAKPKLEEMILERQTDERVVCAAIYALHRMGDTRYAGQLGIILMSDFPLGRATAAMVMGKMGEQSAIGPLNALLAEEHEAGVRLNIIEALANLGDRKSQRILESYARGYFLDLRLAAIPALAASDPNTRDILESLLKNDQPPRVRVSAAGALGKLKLGSEVGFLICIDAIENPEKMLRAGYGQDSKIKPTDISSLRRLGAMALGDIKRPDAIQYLRPLLYEEDGAVKVAAAMSILKIVPPKVVDNFEDEVVEEEPGQAEQPVDIGPKLKTSGGMDLE